MKHENWEKVAGGQTLTLDKDLEGRTDGGWLDKKPETRIQCNGKWGKGEDGRKKKEGPICS